MTEAIVSQSRPTDTRMSYEEFLRWSDEDTHAEWVNGEVILAMPPLAIHQRVAQFLLKLLSAYAETCNLGEVLLAPFEMRHLPGYASREPDILFVAREHLHRLTPERLEGPADLVVEVVSPSSARRDREEKFAEYEQAGVREYWIIDPREGVERADFYQRTLAGRYVAVLPDATGRYHSAVLPGLWLDVAWLWQDPLPTTAQVVALVEQMIGKGDTPC